MLEFSYFPGFFSNQPQRCQLADWPTFISYMRSISEVEGYKPSADEYDKTQGLISSAIYAEDGMKRNNENVSAWDFVLLDIDKGIDDAQKIVEKFKAFSYLIYSTANCTRNHLKIRVCIPLHKRAPKEVLKQLWFACNAWCDDLVDDQTKDLSRMHYIPARYTNKGSDYCHIFKENVGIDLNWEQLIAKYPMPPESDKYRIKNPLRDLKQKLFKNNHGTPSMDITSSDCPFVDKWMMDDYRLTPAGAHHKAIYVFMLKICGKAEKIGYPLSVEELADMGKQMDDLDGGWYDQKKLLDSAKDAIEYAAL